MTSISDKDYNKLAKEAYKLNPKEQTDLDDQRVIGDIFNINGRKFQVIDAIGNSIELNYNSM